MRCGLGILLRYIDQLVWGCLLLTPAKDSINLQSDWTQEVRDQGRRKQNVTILATCPASPWLLESR